MSGKAQPPEKLPGRPTLHGAYQRPTRSRRVRRARRRYVAWLTENCNPSSREQLLISTTADAMVRLSEANAYLDKVGLVDGDGQPAGVTKIYVALINTIRRNLEALGLRPEIADQLPKPWEYSPASTGNGATAPEIDADAETDTEDAVEESDEHGATQDAPDSRDGGEA